MAVVVMVLFAALAPPSDASITCSTVLTDLIPCLTYLRSGSGKPPAPCCAGAKSLASAATSTPDKQTACACLKQASKSMNVQSQLAQSLPGNCGISLPYTISPTVDCTKYLH